MGDCGLCETQLRGDDATRYLCDGCSAATSGRLAALPMLYRDLAAFLRPGSPAPGPRSSTRSSGTALPVSEPVLDIRGPGGLVTLLELWREAVHADRGWTAPRTHGSIEDRVKRAAKSLQDNMTWIASSWPAAGAMAEEVRDAHRDILSIVAPGDPRGRRIGYCIAAYEDGAICGAAIWAAPGATSLQCDWCRCVYEAKDFLTLAVHQPEAEDAA